jgi:hypothetical protein
MAGDRVGHFSHTTIPMGLLPQHGTRTVLQMHCWRSLTFPKNSFQRKGSISYQIRGLINIHADTVLQNSAITIIRKHTNICCLDWLDLHHHISRTGRVVLVAQRHHSILFLRWSIQLTPDPALVVGKLGYWEATQYIKICNANPYRSLYMVPVTDHVTLGPLQ